MEKIEFDTPFNTPYIARYTESMRKREENEFVTDYVVKTVDTDIVISIETRSKKKRFKSRLVEK